MIHHKRKARAAYQQEPLSAVGRTEARKHRECLAVRVRQGHRAPPGPLRVGEPRVGSGKDRSGKKEQSKTSWSGVRGSTEASAARGGGHPVLWGPTVRGQESGRHSRCARWERARTAIRGQIRCLTPPVPHPACSELLNK